MDRRTFLGLALGAAAGALPGGRALARPRRGGEAEHAGKPDRELRRREEAKNVLRGPNYQPPAQPLALPPWRYGRSSAAPDTVLSKESEDTDSPVAVQNEILLRHVQFIGPACDITRDIVDLMNAYYTRSKARGNAKDL